MIRFFRHVDPSFQGMFRQDNLSPLMASVSCVPLLFGLVSGALVGFFSETSSGFLFSLDFLLSGSDSPSFFRALFVSFRFILLAWLCSTSILGVVLLPLLAALRAFCFGCCAAVLLQTPTVEAYLNSIISFGLPLLFELPAFLLSVSDAHFLSGKLLFRDRRRGIANPPFLYHAFLILLLCLLESLYCRFLMPGLLVLV